MNREMIESKYGGLRAGLKIDCGACSGLCCVALYCAKTDGFPADKEAGVPCAHLMGDCRCDIHGVLAGRGMRGCLAYDCFGAGQRVTARFAPGGDWRSGPQRAEEMFRVFQTTVRLRQMEWYLLEALSLTEDPALEAEIEKRMEENERMTALPFDALSHLDLDSYQTAVNRSLRQAGAAHPGATALKIKGKDHLGQNFKRAVLDGADFSMALLIAANLEGCSLRGANLLGADLRDANVCGADFSGCMFLTQMQVNSARGNGKTKLPLGLTRPTAWAVDEGLPR